MSEQGPTEEEITAFLAGSDISLNMKRGFVRAALARIEPLTRARHVREAVEGLSDERFTALEQALLLAVTIRLASRQIPESAASADTVARSAIRAALLAALTGEK